MTAKAVILGAGIGSRLRPLTDAVPKCLVPVGGRPMLDLWLEKLLHAGIHDVLINTHAHADRVREYIADANATGLFSIVETYEPELLGSAGTISANAAFAADADLVVIIYPDNLSQVDLRRMVEFHRSHEQPATMLLFRAANPKACGIATVDTGGLITRFVEKPAEPESNLANAGVYVFDSAAYQEVAAIGGRDIGFDVLPRFVGRMQGYDFGGFHHDIGSLADYHRCCEVAESLLRRGRTAKAGLRPAVFLDRDGTIIRQVHYLSDPAAVEILPGAAESITAMRESGFVCVAVTNQSAIGRGELTLETYREVQSEVERQLAVKGAHLDATYYCPHPGENGCRRTVGHVDRKPGPGMLLRAAEELGLDLASSWMVGDMASDVLAGINAGCCGTVMVRTGHGPRSVRAAQVAGVQISDGLPEAAELIRARTAASPTVRGLNVFPEME